MNELPVHNFIFQHSWNQLLYPRVIEVCRLPFEPRHDFFLTTVSPQIQLFDTRTQPHVSAVHSYAQ
jgi:hypothetical protein